MPRFAFEKFPAADADPDHDDEVGRRGDVDRPQLHRGAAEGAALAREAGQSASTGTASGPPPTQARALLEQSRDAPPTAGSCWCSRPCAAACRSRRCTRPPASTRGSSTRSRSSTSVADAVVAAPAADRRPAAAGQAARLQRRASSPQLRGMPEAVVRGVRHALGVRPVYKTVDTCAAEFAALTPYHYSTYDEETEVAPRERPAVHHPRLRPEPHRPGRRVRLLLRARQLRPARRRLRHGDGQLQPRDGLDRLRHQQPALLRAAHARGRARGRPRRAPGRADRRRHRAARRADPARAGQGAQGRGRADRRHLARGDRPRRGPRRVRPGAAPRRSCPRRKHGTAYSAAEAVEVAQRDRLPGARAAVLRARRARHGDRLRRRRPSAATSSGPPSPSPEHPVLVDRFLDDAIEIDVDALYDGTEMYLGGIMEHIEEAGIHSGDSLVHAAAGHPRCRTSSSGCASRRSSWRRASACAGLMNVQFALAQDILYVLEANPRASRTVPFVAKATGVPLAKAAARIMLGATIAELRAEGVLPRARRRRPDAGARTDVGQGGGAAVQAVPHQGGARRRQPARPRDALHRRGHGHRHRLRPRRSPRAQLGAISGLPTQGNGVRVGRQPRQAGHDLPGQAAGRPRLPHRVDRRAPQTCCGATGSRPRWCASTPSAAPRASDRSSTGSTPARSTWSSTPRAGRARRPGPTATPSGRRRRRWTSRSSPRCSSSRAAVQAIEAVITGDLDVTSLQDHAAALDLYGVEATA